MNEIERIKKDYQEKEEKRSKLWTYFNPVNLYLVHEREQEILYILNKMVQRDLSDLKILDIGCGHGKELAKYIFYGAKPTNLFGVDIIEDRIIKAKNNFSSISFSVSNASNLDFFDESFDVIIQMTVFSSIFDNNLKLKIASEIERLLSKDGVFIWYDIKPCSNFEKKLNRFCEISTILIDNPKYFFSKLYSKFNLKIQKATSSEVFYDTNIKEIDKNEVIAMFKNLKPVYSTKLGILYHLLKLLLKIPFIIPFIKSMPFFKTHELLILRK